ncbi:MAG: hypothetical protein ACREMT_01435, partial [Vulcanimicrobiaceae bacterium]
VVGLGINSVLGDGSKNPETDAADLAAGIPRFDEMANGVIPHAIFASAACVSSTPVYPATANSQGLLCSNGQTAPPMGSRLQLTLTDSQIDNLAVDTWMKAVLHAMHDYGIYIADTSGSTANGLSFRFESQTQYFVSNNSCNGNATTSSDPPSCYPITQTIINDVSTMDRGSFLTGGWSANLRVVDPCYAAENCPTYP